PPLTSNDLLDGFRYIRNLARAVVDRSTARADSLDLVVCAATQAPEPKNGVAAVGQSQRQGHHDGLVRLITSGLNDGKGEVHADDRDVSLAEDLEVCPVQSAEISMPSDSELAPVLYGPAIMIHMQQYSLGAAG